MTYGPAYVQGDVIGVGYRPRTGTIFFTRNGKKLEDVAHGLKTQNFFPTVGATGPCQVHVNFGQMGFVFIEANVKKWGLAPMTGSLAPPPPYGSEQGSILLEGGREGVREGMAGYMAAGFHGFSQGHGHGRSSSQQMRLGRNQPTSPGPQRSPTDISLAQLSLVDSHDDVGEGSSSGMMHQSVTSLGIEHIPHGDEPPGYESPARTPDREASHPLVDDEQPRHPPRQSSPRSPPIPSYDAAIAETPPRRR